VHGVKKPQALSSEWIVMWKFREKLNYYERLRRSLYNVLRDSLERRLMKLSLVDSYYKYEKNDVDYSFLEKSELKPRCRKMETESEIFNTFLVIFSEGVVGNNLKNYLRFFPENSVIKKNLAYLASFSLYNRFHLNMRYFETPGFLDLAEELLKVDYALLIQPDPFLKKKNRYSLTHFHVKVDWPIADAAEDLAKYLRYIQTNLYENGDETARILQNKLFEYYGCHHNVGGRRTAGLIAAQLLRRMDTISTVYVSSSEARAMYKYSERGVSKFFLLKIDTKQAEALAQREGLSIAALSNDYLYQTNDSNYIAIAEAMYEYTPHSKPPEDGKLRKVRSAYHWLKLQEELLHPKENSLSAAPITIEWVYAGT
jgi:hypothetical protein